MAEPAAIVTSPPSGDAIFELLGELRDAGFSLGIREHVVAQELALACHPEGEDIDPVRLRNWLAPALCHSPEEQRELYRVFQTWWSRRVSESQTDARADQKHPVSDEAVVERSLPWKWVLSFAAALALVAAAVYLVDQRRHRDGRTAAPGSAAVPADGGAVAPIPPAAGRLKEISAPNARDVLSIIVNVVDHAGTPVPGALVHTEIRLVHGAAVGSAGFSPDGSRIVTATGAGTARVWDTRTWQPVGATLQHGDRINSAVFSADGTRLVTASDDRTARVWDARTGQSVGAPLQHADRINSAVFSADGIRVATASEDRTARVWDARTGQPVGAPLQHADTVHSVAFVADGTRLVTASDDSTARMWDARTGQPVGAPLLHRGGVNSAVFSADGTRVLTASSDMTARIWDARTGQPVGAPLQHQAGVNSAAFSVDGTRVLTASSDTTARIWDARTGRSVGAALQHKEWVYSAAFSADGTRVATASTDSTARLWDARTGQPVGLPLQHGDWVFSAAFSADGTRVVTASRDSTARVWGAATGQLVGPPLQHGYRVNSATFNLAGTHVVTASADGTARVWDARTGQPVGAPLEHEGRVTSAAFSSDGMRVVTASEDKTARVWDARTGLRMGAPLRHGASVMSAAFSADGTRVLTASEDKTARVWDTATGRELARLGHDDVVLMAVFSPDGRLVLTASSDKTARVWDSQTGQGVSTSLQHEDAVSSAVFSADGTRVVTASRDRTARVWDARTGQPLAAPLRHAAVVLSAAFSPDGTRVVTTSADKTARVWNAASGQALGSPMDHPGADVSASFSTDGTRIVTASGGTVRVWNAATGEIIGAPFEHQDSLQTASFSPDGNRIVAAASEGAILLSPSSALQTERDGVARLSWNDPPQGQGVAVTHADYESIAPYATDYGPGRLTLLAELGAKRSRPTRWLLEHADLLRLIGAVVPLLAAASWTAWGFYRRRLVLERRASTQAHDLARVRLAEPAHRLYRAGPFVRARIEAHRRQTAAEGELDADATIERTIRHLGFFSPVFRPRSRLPAYLALVDRAGFHDQQARAVEEFVDGLREGGVSVDTYFFDRDPRLCTISRSSHRDGAYRTLWELSALHAEHRLLLFGDGSGLADPASGRVATWTIGFSPWSERALLTPVPACHWSARELDVARSGFRVVPFTPAGLRLFLESLQPTNLRPALLEWRAPYPPLLAEQPGRWQGRGRPRSEELEELCWQLRAYLGPDGFRWLAALAAYPAMDWFLTLYMGLGLRTKAGIPLLEEELLLALARLPWLRHGFMPDRLRLRLISQLGIEDRRTVRALLENLLRARLESPGGRFHLEVARPATASGGRRWRRFFADLLRTEPHGSPLHDYVFVELLLGRRPTKLQIPAPGGWRPWVYRRGLRALGIQPVIVMAAATLLAVTATFSARSIVERLNARQTSATPSRITQTSWTPGAVTTGVPRLIGLKMDAAVRALDAAHLALGSSYSPDEGAIVNAQNPAPGAVVPAGSWVDVKTAGAFPTSAEKVPETTTLTVDVIVDQGSDIGESLLTAVFRDLQREHITVARLLDSKLSSMLTRDNLDVDEVILGVLRNGELRSPDKASYTILVTDRRLSRPRQQLDNLFYFAHHRFGLLSVRNLDDSNLAILIGDMRQGERVELLRKYLTAFIPLTAMLGEANARQKTLIADRGPATDHGCLSDFSNQLRALIDKLRAGPAMCPEEYDGIASTFGATVAADYKAILDRAAKTVSQ